MNLTSYLSERNIEMNSANLSVVVVFHQNFQRHKLLSTLRPHDISQRSSGQWQNARTHAS